MATRTAQKPPYLLNEFDKPLYLLAHFGFIPIEHPRLHEKDFDLTKDCKEIDTEKPNVPHGAAERAAFLRHYVEKELVSLPHPLAVAYKKFDPGKKSRDYCLHVVGFPSALAETILIRAALSLLMEEGRKFLVVEVNTMGDKDSLAAYERELIVFSKKIANDLSPEYKQRLKRDIFEIFKLDLPEEIKGSIPPAIASLSAAGRAHFKDMLEYLESLGVEFRLAHTLIGNRHYMSHTVFAIRDRDTNEILADGAHYTRLSKRVGLKKELPAVCMTIYGNSIKSTKETTPKMYKDLPKPKFYLVQLGREAKMKALPLIELLRSHRIPVYHFLGKDKITAQLGNAENLRVPYLLIIGQKEALDGTVTVRNMITRAQDTISVAILPGYLKTISL